jgi:hypothetical protein
MQLATGFLTDDRHVDVEEPHLDVARSRSRA